MSDGTDVRHRTVAWAKADPFGAECVEIALRKERLSATGVAIGTDPLAYRLDYELETDAGFVTTRLRVSGRGDGWRRELDLRRSAAGVWTITAQQHGRIDLPAAGGDAGELGGALDCDLALSPLTNTMPIRRHGLLHGGGPIECQMAWVAVPALSVRVDGQRYRHVESRADRHVVRYESIDGSFTATLTVDDDGIVIDYPGIARRVPARSDG